MTDCCLDTCVFIDWMKGRGNAFDAIAPFSHPSISHVVFGELLLGGHKASNPREKEKILNALAGIDIINGDSTTSAIYANVRFDLEKRGEMIPQNDIWIAAISIQKNVPLVTSDPHFRRVRGLKLLEY